MNNLTPSPMIADHPAKKRAARSAALTSARGVSKHRWRWRNTVAAMSVALTLFAGRAPAEPKET